MNPVENRLVDDGSVSSFVVAPAAAVLRRGGVLQGSGDSRPYIEGGSYVISDDRRDR